MPEMARIVAVAAAYVRMTNKQRYSDASPDFVAREAFVKGAGEAFDPVFANAMVKIIDSDGRIDVQQDEEIENEFTCGDYREYITRGISVDRNIKSIRFEFLKNEDISEGFSEPALVLFDSFDRRVHRDDKTIEEYHYTEYGEIWFNGHVVSSGARKMEVKDVDEAGNGTEGKKSVNTFEIVAMRFEDHIKLVLSGGGNKKEIIVALPDRSKASYIGLTGENCTIRNIVVETDDKEVGLDDIPRIVSETSYIEHMEADIKNVQIDRQRSASTIGIELEKKLKITFHSMSLPSAMLVWHCPYIVLFSSDDGKVGGPNYLEYTLIKLNGENDTAEHHAQNKFNLKKKDSFPGWEAWKTYNRNGMECEVYIEKKDNRIVLKTENLGINIENITTIEDMPEKVYVALTGDQVALTDIRIH